MIQLASTSLYFLGCGVTPARFAFSGEMGGAIVASMVFPFPESLLAMESAPELLGDLASRTWGKAFISAASRKLASIFRRVVAERERGSWALSSMSSCRGVSWI